MDNFSSVSDGGYNRKEVKFFDKIKWMINGSKGYKKLLSYDEFSEQYKSAVK